MSYTASRISRYSIAGRKDARAFARFEPNHFNSEEKLLPGLSDLVVEGPLSFPFHERVAFLRKKKLSAHFCSEKGSERDFYAVCIT